MERLAGGLPSSRVEARASARRSRWPARAPASRSSAGGPSRSKALVDTLESEGRTAFALPADVTDPDAAEYRRGPGALGPRGRAGQQCRDQRPRRDLANLSVADWDAVLRVNLTGTFLVTHAVLPIMRSSGPERS